MTRLIGNPDAFPILRRWNFLNHAAVSPLPAAAGEAFRRYANQAESAAYLEAGWYRQVGQLRASAARLINASPDEIALVKNTSEGLATVAGGLDWHPGDRIVTTAVEYPANIYPWMDLQKRLGVELVMVGEQDMPDGSRAVPTHAILDAASHPRTRLLTLSHVQYATGQRHDLAAIGRFCRERNILFCVDAIQSLGALPVDVAAMNIDYLSADGHKWLLGPEGAGIFYCRRDLLPSTRPPLIGWMNVIHAEDFGHYDFTLKPDARKFECGSWNIPGFLALSGSLDLLLSTGIDAIRARVRQITDRLVVGLQAAGHRVISPRDGDQDSGIVSFIVPGHDPRRLLGDLRHNHRIELALREGRLRASPHFYNTEPQIDQLLAALPRPRA